MARLPEPFRMDSGELAGYRIESLIGRGGMAYVYRAVYQRLGRTVALKVLSPELAQDEGFRTRFLRESRLAASIDHPNVIPIYDAGEADDVLYIAMRYVEGPDLKALLAKEKQLDPARVVDIFSQVADALDAAHAHGLVHRDVKPANVLIAPGTGVRRDHVYLSDFGVTKRLTSLSGVTAPGIIIGTMDYLAPEQISGEPVSARTDVYALGCVVYQALTGSVPFVRDDDAALLWAHLAQTLPPVTQRRPDLPPEVDDVLAKATAKDPEDRYGSCGEFLGDLAALLQAPRPEPHAQTLGGYPRPTEVPVSPAMQPRAEPPGTGARNSAGGRRAAVPPRRLRRRGLWAVLGATVALALAATAVLLVTTRGTKMTRFTGTDTVPVSFEYPANWRPVDSGIQMVVSPHADAFLNLFIFGATAWDKVDQVARNDHGGALGMYVTFTNADYSEYDEETLRSQLQKSLPKRAELQAPRSDQLGSRPAFRLDGRLSDPSGIAPELRVSYYIVEINGRTFQLVLFADAGYFDDHVSLFEAIAGSVGPPA